jgi:hypothetical protein
MKVHLREKLLVEPNVAVDVDTAPCSTLSPQHLVDLPTGHLEHRLSGDEDRRWCHGRDLGRGRRFFGARLEFYRDLSLMPAPVE